jgi:hypothetical protein
MKKLRSGTFRTNNPEGLTAVEGPAVNPSPKPLQRSDKKC